MMGHFKTNGVMRFVDLPTSPLRAMLSHAKYFQNLISRLNRGVRVLPHVYFFIRIVAAVTPAVGMIPAVV